MINLFPEIFKKNMKNNKGKGIILGLSSLLYAILRMSDIISNPIYILDIFMVIVLVYSIYLIKFKLTD